jgi:hypothetical protein
MALLKNLKLTESKTLEFRAEFFDVFNHTEFYGPTAVNDLINSTAFGTVTSAQNPRIGQLASASSRRKESICDGCIEFRFQSLPESNVDDHGLMCSFQRLSH